MKKFLYVIQDIKSVFLPPFTANSDAEAIRLFSDSINDGQSLISKHPSDFVLYRIGTFDVSNAKIEVEDNFNLGVGSNFSNLTTPQQ